MGASLTSGGSRPARRCLSSNTSFAVFSPFPCEMATKSARSLFVWPAESTAAVGVVTVGPSTGLPMGLVVIGGTIAWFVVGRPRVGSPRLPFPRSSLRRRRFSGESGGRGRLRKPAAAGGVVFVVRPSRVCAMLSLTLRLFSCLRERMVSHLFLHLCSRSILWGRA